MAWLLALFLHSGPLHAQTPGYGLEQYAHDRWSMDDGLPFPGGYKLAQDSSGYLWLGSMAGLARFDGQHFSTHDQANTPAMPGNLIRGMSSDNQGRLWIGTDRGVMFHHQGRFTAVPAMAGKNVSVIGRSRDGAVLLSNDEAVYRTGQGQTLVPVAGLKSVHHHAYHQGNWYASAEGLFRQIGDRFVPQPLPGLGTGNITRLLGDPTQLLVGASSGLYLLQQGRLQRHADPALHKRILAMTADSHGNVWVTIELTLFRLRAGQIVETIDIGSVAPAVRDLLVDDRGSLWLASHAHGLHRIWNGVGRYLPIPHHPSEAQFMWAVAYWQGAIHTAGTFGLTRLEGDTQVPVPGSGGLPNIYSLFPEGERLWLGTTRGVYAYQNGLARPVPGLEALGDTRTNTFLRSGDGSLWLGTSRGLYRQLPGQTLQRLTGHDNSTHWEIRSLLQRTDGDIYVAGDHGLWRVRDDKLEAVDLPGSHGGIYALHELDNGQLLAGDRGRGLLYLHDGRQWHTLDSNRGIPRNEVYAFIADPQGGVLVTGMRGAYRLDASQLQLASQSATAMLQVQPGLTLHRRDAPGQQAVCCLGGGDGRGLLHQGRYYLPASRGLFTLASPLATRQGHSAPRIEQVATPRGTYQAGTQALSLSNAERDLRISFSVRNLSPLHWPRILYRLEGYDQQWQALPPGVAPHIRYTNLPGGQYRFQVTDASSGTDTASQDIAIAPAFHQTRLFAVLLTLASLGLFWLSLWLGSVWNRRRRQQLEALVALHTRDLAQANDQLDRLARTDPLTGLNNRRHAAGEIPQRLATTGQVDPAAEQHLFVLMDVDHFKAINDTHGHDVGDAVLVEIANRLRQHLRQGDCLARWGGEEFLMVCFALPQGEHAALAQRLLTAVSQQPVKVPGAPALPVTVSLGLALTESRPAADSIYWKDCIRRADSALYASKSAGRNCWSLYNSHSEGPATTTACPAAARLQPHA